MLECCILITSYGGLFTTCWRKFGCTKRIINFYPWDICAQCCLFFCHLALCALYSGWCCIIEECCSCCRGDEGGERNNNSDSSRTNRVKCQISGLHLK